MPSSQKSLIGAPVTDATLGKELSGIDKLARMTVLAIEEAIEELPSKCKELAVLFCLPEKTPASYFNNERGFQKVVDAVFQKIEIFKPHKSSVAIWEHRCGFVSALLLAQDYLYNQKHDYILIVTLDSLLNPASIGYYCGSQYGEDNRLLDENNPDGFIPGEAASAVLLSVPPKHPSSTQIVGIGVAEETATVGNEDEVLKGKGLSEAINTAAQQAEIEVHETSFRIASVSGEAYFFSEASLAQYRTLKKKIVDHPLWHPATNIGEVGASIGGAIVVMAHHAFERGYAPGNLALCHISNDNPLRGAFVMQHID